MGARRNGQPVIGSMLRGVLLTTLLLGAMGLVLASATPAHAQAASIASISPTAATAACIATIDDEQAPAGSHVRVFIEATLHQLQPQSSKYPGVTIEWPAPTGGRSNGRAGDSPR